MARAISKPVIKRCVLAFARLQQLLYRRDLYEGFALEREYYLYTITNREFQLKSDVL